MIVAGFGCRSSVDDDGLRAAFTAAARQTTRITAIATLMHKRDLLLPLSREMGLPLLLVRPEAIDGLMTTTGSPASLAAYRTGSVAEAVALIAVGPAARLIAPRTVSPCRSATCALAQGAPA